MKKFLLALAFLPALALHAQRGKKPVTNNAWKNIYRGTVTKVNDLVHTKLDAKFDYANAHLLGKAWITLTPHFYATDSLTLDAKGMDINNVSIVSAGKNIALEYDYSDNMQLKIKLNRTYKPGESYTIYVDYISKPNDLKVEGSSAITDAKGLYFINPTGEDKEKPTQIWTQGETEATSVWVPTIDKPNQKTTTEFNLTVPAKYVTLSNGLMTAQKKNTDGTRTDTWKMTLPHAPYLFFMGVGDYAVIKDSYKGKEVSYYVEKPYASVARGIFGLTPEMMKFFSTKLGVEYAWPKYSQIVGRDYVSGAMENTTATLHQENAQQNARELTDGNRWEDVISHELFHHWFGDYVTAESWSNLTVNESFADYSEYLWQEYKHGKDNADQHAYEAMTSYLNSRGSATKDLVRFYYRDKEDMFDLVSYQKGGRILNMLRNYVGDDAFFKSLNVYLTKNKFGNGSAHKLRLAFEEVTGKDLNWFFNQWYFGNGHPILNISNNYDAASQRVSLHISQQAAGTDSTKVFKLPFAVDVYTGTSKKRYNVWLNGADTTYSFPVTSKPSLVNVDAERVILADKEYSKSPEEFLFQYRNAKLFNDRIEAIDSAIANNDNSFTQNVLVEALNDGNPYLRQRAIQGLMNSKNDAAIVSKIEAIAKNDKDKKTRATAIDFLATLKNISYKAMFVKATTDSSYTVAGAALSALVDIDETAAVALLPELKKDAEGKLETAIDKAEILTKTDADFEDMSGKFEEANIFEKLNLYENFVLYLSRVNNTENFKKGVDQFVALRDQIANFAPQAKEALNKDLETLKTRKQSAKGLDATARDEQIRYIDEKLK